MKRADSHNRRQSDDGFVLVAVLWILGGLSVLAAVYAVYVVNAATSLEVSNDRIQTNASIVSALELTAYRLDAVKKDDRPTSGSFSFRIGNSRVAVGFLNEAARIDLNLAPKPILAGLFRTLGARADAAEYYGDRIIGWRTKSTAPNPDQDKEIVAYRNAGLPYNPRQAPFTNVQELWLLLGLPPAVVERALPYVTVFSGLATVDVMDAAPEVVAALPGMTPDRLDSVLAERRAGPANAARVLQMLGPAQASATAKGSNATRVAVEVTPANGRRRIHAQAVILPLEDAEEPYRVLSWIDDFDG
jgi:general secretion pathway protein K